MQGPLRSWVVPAKLADECATNPGERSKAPWYREVRFKKLDVQPLVGYEDNWSMEVKELASSATEA
jgi:hypothetical protein